MRLKEGQNEQATRQRLLEAAGEVFAAKGYRAATVREIIRRAGANIAAAHYHFGDKAALYAAAFRHARACTRGERPVEAAPGDRPARERLEGFVRAMFRRVLSTDRPAWAWQLMMREMAEPTGLGVLEEMVRDSIAQDFQVMAGIVREISGFAADDPRMRMCVASVIGQVLFYKHAQPIWRLLHPEQAYGQAEVEAIVRHVVQFSVGGMEAIGKTKIQNPKSKERSKAEIPDPKGGSGASLDAPHPA
jgi:AcrR family transcriptional regulator